MSTSVVPAAPKLLVGLPLLVAAVLIGLGNFLVVLNTTIANVSVPTIAGNLGISSSQGTWVITSYAVAEAICVPLTGWLAQRFGAVRALDGVSFTPDPVFRVAVPEECPGVPRELLKPRQTWPDRDAYDVKARELAALFKKNFEQYAAECSPEVRAAGPE